MIEITDAVFWDMMNYGKSKLPEEACGVLLGDPTLAITRITGFTPIRNAAEDPTKHFLLDPEEWISMIYSLEYYRNQKQQLIGVFHTHPSQPAVPSNADKNQIWSMRLGLIISFQNKEDPEAEAYRIMNNQWLAEPLCII